MKSPLRVMRISLIVCLLATFSIAQTPQENAWTTLDGGLINKSWEKRVKAVSVLSELTGDEKAEEAALTALKDDRAEVRGAAAQSLGEMGAKSAIPQLMAMISDKEPAVILAAARSLITLGDNRGYNAFYAVLTGETKTGTSLTDQQKKTLKDPKKMAGLGLQVGVGFIPFGGLAMGGYKMLTKDDTSPVLAGAALVLAKDPDPKSGQALANAATAAGKMAGSSGGIRRHRQARRSILTTHCRGRPSRQAGRSAIFCRGSGSPLERHPSPARASEASAEAQGPGEKVAVVCNPGTTVSHHPARYWGTEVGK